MKCLIFTFFNNALVLSNYFLGDKELTRRSFSDELSPFPLSLFDTNGMMRKSNKAELYELLTSNQLMSQSLINTFTYVIDGGWLLSKYVWPHCKSYKDIFEGYRQFVITTYGANSTIVFDEYSNEVIGTKSYERYRRKEKTMASPGNPKLNFFQM